MNSLSQVCQSASAPDLRGALPAPRRSFSSIEQGGGERGGVQGVHPNPLGLFLIVFSREAHMEYYECLPTLLTPPPPLPWLRGPLAFRYGIPYRGRYRPLQRRAEASTVADAGATSRASSLQ
jgi:hypothetical protein